MLKIGPFTFSYNANKGKEIEEVKKEQKKDNKSSKSIKQFIVKAGGFIKNYSFMRDGFEYPDYNMEEIKIACASDSYIKTALGKYSNLIFKAGYTLKGDNQKAIDYINTRWKIMNISTRQSINILFEGIAKDIVTYGNCFIIKVRVNSDKIGVKANGVKSKNPVGGYFRLPPETVSIKRDMHGNVLKYRQKVNGEEAEYSPDDIIHIFIDKDANSAFGTPRIQAALEDVKMLRRIEGNILSLIYRFAMPVYQWKIGIPESGYQASDREIEEARAELERTSLDGIYITNEKTDIKAIGAEGTALDATGYLNYFEARVFSALEVSTAQMGRDSTKANSDSVETQIHDTVKYMQRMIKEQIENQMITELLLEGGFNPILKDEDEVSFNFEEISLDTKVKIENHELNKYQSNLITLEEARQAIGKEAYVEEKDLYQFKITDESAKVQSANNTKDAIKLSKAQHELQLDMLKENEKVQRRAAKENAKNFKKSNNINQDIENNINSGQIVKSDIKEKPDGKGLLGNGKPKGSKVNKAVKTLANPENQHGVTSVKIKENLNLVGLDKENHKKNFSHIYKNYKDLCNTIIEDENSRSYKNNIVNTKFEDLYSLIALEMEKYSIDGMKQAQSDYYKIYKKSNQINDIIIIDYDNIMEALKKDVYSLRDDIKDKLRPNNVENLFDTLEYRLRFIIEYFLPKSYYYSYLSASKHFGVSKAKVQFSKDSDDKEMYDEIIELNILSLKNIPPYHSFCKCSVRLIG